MDLIVRNGTVVNATGAYKADVGVVDGKIALLGDLSQVRAKEDLDAEGRYVLPGAVDVHTHLDAPGSSSFTADNFETGTVAAAHGGTTTIVDFCRQGPGQTLADAIRNWHIKAGGKAVIDYGFHIIITDPRDDVLEEIRRISDLGVTSIKLFMAY